MSCQTISREINASGIVLFRSPRSRIFSAECFLIQAVSRSQSWDCRAVWAAVNWYTLRR